MQSIYKQVTGDLRNWKSHQNHHLFSDIDVCKQQLIKSCLPHFGKINVFIHYRQLIVWVADDFALACMQFLSTTVE